MRWGLNSQAMLSIQIIKAGFSIAYLLSSPRSALLTGQYPYHLGRQAGPIGSNSHHRHHRQHIFSDAGCWSRRSIREVLEEQKFDTIYDELICCKSYAFSFIICAFLITSMHYMLFYMNKL